MSDLVKRLRDSSPNEGSHDLYCRCISAADEIERKDAAIADLTEAIESHNALVRKLDVLLNGEDGAAKQASLCDIVSQVSKESPHVAIAELVQMLKDARREEYGTSHYVVHLVDAAIAKYDK